MTIHVAEDGTVTYGLPVPRMKNRDGDEKYLLAASPKRVHGRRFIPAGVPRGVDLNVTAPHDCRDHWPDTPVVPAFGDFAGEVFTENDRVALTGGAL